MALGKKVGLITTNTSFALGQLEDGAPPIVVPIAVRRAPILLASP